MKKITVSGKCKAFTYLGGMLILCVLLSLQGCKKGTDNQAAVNQSSISPGKFIDIDSIGEKKIYSAKDDQLFIEARDRIEKYIVVKDGLYSLNIENGAAIGLSERVFDLLKRCMLYTNGLITRGDLVIYEGKLVRKIIQSPQLRVFDDTETATNSGVFGSVTATWHLWGVNLNFDNKATLWLLAGSGTVATLLTCFPASTLPGKAFQIVLMFTSAYYTTNSNLRGFNVDVTWYDGPDEWRFNP
jgi:hypothetical protein